MTSKKNFFLNFFSEFLKIAYFVHNSARFEEKNFFLNFEKIFLKISHLEKNVISDTIFEFWLVFHTLTICLKSCNHDYVRNFYVKCIPFAHQHIWKIQSAIRYPVVLFISFFYVFFLYFRFQNVYDYLYCTVSTLVHNIYCWYFANFISIIFKQMVSWPCISHEF